MIVWLILLLVTATFARLLLRGGHEPWPLVASALAFGLVGYALTGTPMRPEQTAKLPANDSGAFPALLDARQNLLPLIGETGAWITFADARARQGHALDAIDALQEAIGRQPNDAALWTALGNALLLQAEGMLTPAARLAYARAIALTPNDPAPRTFLALAEHMSGTEHSDFDRSKARPGAGL